jgi:hypothetical protein
VNRTPAALSLLLGFGTAATIAAPGCPKPEPAVTAWRDAPAVADSGPTRRDAAADIYVPAAPPGPTGTIEGTVYLDGPIRRSTTRLEVPPAWRNNPGCRDAALRYSQPFDISEPGPMPGALVFAEAREISPGPVREHRIIVRDCDIVPRITFATHRDRIVFHADTRMNHIPRILGVEGATIARVLVPGQPDLEVPTPTPGRYPITVQDLPEWVGGMLWVLGNRFIDTTDVQGHFRITDVPVGQVPVNAWYLGTTEAREIVTVRANQTTRVDFHLRQLPPRPAPPPQAPVQDAGIPVPQ